MERELFWSLVLVLAFAIFLAQWILPFVIGLIMWVVELLFTGAGKIIDLIKEKINK